MLVIPAIDIRGGKCVRLFQGDFGQETVYGDSPVAVAREFVKRGAKQLHVVDLDGAKDGRPVNERLVLDIARESGVPVQAGGGVRSYAAAQAYLNNGVQRVMLSTAAVKNPGLLRRLIRDFGADRIVVALDSKNGRFATEGWTKAGMPVSEGLALLKELGITNLLVTDTARDGTLQGPNFALAEQAVRAGFTVMGAGGISSPADVAGLSQRGVRGAVIGKAIYEGVIEPGFTNTLAKRVIPCLDVKDGLVVKGTRFTELRNVDDPVALARQYSRGGADELVFLDIAATLEGRKTFRELVGRIAQAINIPFTVGGGIGSIDDIRGLLEAGADKVSLGTAAVLQPELVNEAADYFGSQCIVISVDAKQRRGGWTAYVKGGTEDSGRDVLDFCRDMERRGAGELLVNSLDRDGTGEGFDLALLQAVTAAVNIPVIASSGGGRQADFANVFKKTNVDAALGASIFHYKQVTPRALKRYLAKQGIEVRP